MPGKKGMNLPSGMLKAMRTVLGRPDASRDTALMAEMREWLKGNRDAFMSNLSRLEAAHETRKAKKELAQAKEKPEAVGPDEGEDRARELIGELLERVKGG